MQSFKKKKKKKKKKNKKIKKKKKKKKKKPLTDSNTKNNFTVLSLILAEKKDASAKFITGRGD